MTTSLPPGRYFLALWPCASERDAMEDAACRWLHETRQHCRITRPSRYHLTLSFLGGLDRMQAAGLSACMTRLCAMAPEPFELVLDRFGHFGRRAAWLGCSACPPSLLKLESGVSQLMAQAGLLRPSECDFIPHVTMARSMRGDWPSPPRHRPCIRWHVRDFVLVRSVPEHGHAYRVMAHFPAGRS